MGKSNGKFRRQGGSVKTYVLMALLVLLFIPGCETFRTWGLTGESGSGESASSDEVIQGEEKRVSWKFYTPFFDQGDHLKKLVLEEGFSDPAKLYIEQREYFADPKNREESRGDLDTLAERLNDHHAPDLSAAIQRLEGIAWPAPHDQWDAIRGAISQARIVRNAYPREGLLAEPEYISPLNGELDNAISQMNRRIENGAATEFTAFDHFGEEVFFDLYPVPLQEDAFLDANYPSIEPLLETANTGRLQRFAANLTADRLGVERWRKLGDLYVAASLKESGQVGNPSLANVLKAVTGAREAGFEPKNVPGLKIGFVEITSQTLLKQKQIEFPAQIKVDLPAEIAKADIDQALTNPTAETSDYLIVFDVALAKAKRRVTKTRNNPSTILVGHDTRPNPDYNMAQNEVNIAQTNIQSASMNKASADSQFCQGVGCFGKMISQIAAGAKVSEAQDGLAVAMGKLKSTPMTIEVPRYQNYQFQVATVKGEKTMTVHYYVIDHKKNTYFKSTFDVVEKKNFEVGYNISDQDPDKEKNLSTVDSEETVVEWEEQASTVKLSQLIGHYQERMEEAKPLPDIVALRMEIMEDKNTALASYTANRFDARPLNDPRFDSVVVVYVSAKRSLGSGFFIMPDVVLTNWHVVEETKFVEMKAYDGQETFGKVIAKDVRMDLALIKVQSRGKPVRFYTDRSIDLGATVEAIGHPKGMEFSITRGVISSVRRHDNINIGSVRTSSGNLGGGGKGILFVQTDTPINSGNSGGPLFLGDKVIGVNTWVISKKIAEGMNFSVHYSEVLEFIKEYLPEFRAEASQ